MIPRVRAVMGELSAERDCNDISIGTTHFDDDAIAKVIRARLPPAEQRPPWTWLRSGRVTLSATPEGNTIAEIDVIEPRDDTLIIHPPLVLAVEKGRTRIALPTFGGVLFGWVPSSKLEKSKRQYLDLSHDCFTMVTRPKPKSGNFVSCDRDVPLVAEAGHERRLVGRIRARTLFERVRSAAGWVEIEFRDAGVRAAEGASFWSRESDLAGCLPAT
jgi:hypothetical protein